MYTSSEIISSTLKKTRVKKSALSLGLALRFHPSMQDEKTIQNVLKDSEEIAYTMLRNALNPGYTVEMIARLKKLFSKLNYDSHCKSIAVLLRPHDEMVTYLSFSVNPVAYLNKYVSLLELTANADRPPDFYCLVIEQRHARLYEYYQNRLNPVYVSKPEAGVDEKNDCGGLFKQVLQTIERLNGNNEKPVFVTGGSNAVEGFCSSSLYSGFFFKRFDNAAPFDEEILKQLVNKIVSHWNYWYSKFITGRIVITKKTNVLITEIEEVLQALRNGVDGLLLIDKRLKQRLYKSRRVNALSNTADELMNEVERFLTRGNRIEITETGLLKEFGDIALLQYKPSHFFAPSSVCSVERNKKPDTF